MSTHLWMSEGFLIFDESPEFRRGIPCIENCAPIQTFPSQRIEIALLASAAIRRSGAEPDHPYKLNCEYFDVWTVHPVTHHRAVEYANTILSTEIGCRDVDRQFKRGQQLHPQPEFPECLIHNPIGSNGIREVFSMVDMNSSADRGGGVKCKTVIGEWDRSLRSRLAPTQRQLRPVKPPSVPACRLAGAWSKHPGVMHANANRTQWVDESVDAGPSRRNEYRRYQI